MERLAVNRLYALLSTLGLKETNVSSRARCVHVTLRPRLQIGLGTAHTAHKRSEFHACTTLK